MPRPAGFGASAFRRRGTPPPRTSLPGTGNQSFLNGPTLAGSNLDFNSLLGSNVPGLGFDYPHLAAISGNNLGVEALIDPATQANLALALRFQRLAPLGFGGAFYSAPDGFYDSGAAPADYGAAFSSAQPQVIVVQASPAQATSFTQPPAAADDQPPAPLPDGGDFILVTKEGAQITAGAFYHQGSNVIYITPSGARRSVPFSDLDMDSTVLVNQERGTDLHNLL
jgi:hypothetical protein